MELDQLRVFVKAATCGSLSRASVELELTQSALSKRLAALEESLGGRLFHRTGRGLELTEAGKVLLPGATMMLEQAACLRASVQGKGLAISGEVRFGVLPSLSENIVGEVFDQVQQKWPSIRLTVVEGFSDPLEMALNDGSLDFGLLNRYGRIHKDCEELLQTFNTYLVGPRDSPILRVATVEPRRLHDLPLVLPNRPSALRACLDAVTRQEKITPKTVLEVDSLCAMLDAVIRGHAYALLPRHTVLGSRRAHEVALAPLSCPIMRRQVVLKISTARAYTAAVKEVVMIARAVANNVIRDATES